MPHTEVILGVSLAVMGLLQAAAVYFIRSLVDRIGRCEKSCRQAGQEFVAVNAAIKNSEEKIQRDKEWLDEHEKKLDGARESIVKLEQQAGDASRRLESIEKKLDEVLSKIQIAIAKRGGGT